MSRVFINYYKARIEASRLGLVEAEYGDYDDKVSYCCWNKTGKQDGDYDIEAYYSYSTNGRPSTPTWMERWCEDNLGVNSNELEGVE